MASTLDDVFQAALVRVGLPADDGYLSPADVKRWLVSTAQRDVAAEMDWPELHVETTLTIADGDTSPVPLYGAENFLRVGWVALQIPGSTDMWLLESRQRKELIPYQSWTSGEGCYYAVGSDGLGADVLHLAPFPQVGSTITLDYIRKPAPILNSTDQLLVPDHIIPLVEIRTAFLITVRKNNPQQGSGLLADYDRQLRILRDEANTVRGPIRPKVRQDW